MEALRTEGLTYTYSVGTPFEKTAVDHVDLSIEAGELVGVIGHTGSGKSTLIQHFNGLLMPTSGRIFVHGRDIWADKKQIRRTRFEVGLVFQYPEYQLFEETVYRDIAFGPRNMGLSQQEIDRRVRETASAVGISDAMLQKEPFALSGGEKRKVAIAGVMAMEPKILILDEPTAGLDPLGRTQVLELIRSYHKKTGCTVLLVSHSMEDVARYASKILVMSAAQLFCYDTPTAVFSRAEELQELGLTVPQITRVFHALKARGLDLGEEVYTTGFARDLILSYLNRKEGGAC